MAVDRWRQALRKELQHIVAFGNLSNVLDVGRRHLNTARVDIASESERRLWSPMLLLSYSVELVPSFAAFEAVWKAWTLQSRFVGKRKGIVNGLHERAGLLENQGVPAHVLAKDGHVVGNDECAEYTRRTPVGRSSGGPVQPGNLSK